MTQLNIRYKPIPIVTNEKIIVTSSSESIRRFFVIKFDGIVYEVNRNTYTKIKNSPYFGTLIINWYISGTEEFVRSRNADEVKRASAIIPSIHSILVNMLQFFRHDNRFS